MFNVILSEIVDKLNKRKIEKEKKDRIFCNFKHELGRNRKSIQDGELFSKLKIDALEEIFHNTRLFPNVKVLYSLSQAYDNISKYIEELKDKNYDKKLIHEGIKNLFEPSMTTIVNFKPELILNPNYDGFLSNKKIQYDGKINWTMWGTIIGAIVLVFVILEFLGIESINDIISFLSEDKEFTHIVREINMSGLTP